LQLYLAFATDQAGAYGMKEKPTYRIDGAAFDDLAGFYAEVGEQLLGGAEWAGNPDAFNDVLRGGFGGVPSQFVLVWEHSGLSRHRLGHSGKGSFDDLIEIIAEHPNVELILS
jgi:hypothetical protein